MNLYGHTAVATWCSTDPELALGAMLPDLVGLARVRTPEPRTAPSSAGIALHHETDRIFHASEPFVTLCTRALDVLQEGGLSRPAARATAHVGIELLLDGELAEDARARAAFEAALTLEQAALERAFRWRDAEDARHVRSVAVRLLAADIPDAYRDPDLVAERLYRILARRPRLAFPKAQIPVVRDWTRSAKPDVRASTPVLLAELRAGHPEASTSRATARI